MIKISLNNNEMILPAVCSLGHALENYRKKNNHSEILDHFAIAINQRFIPRSMYEITLLREGDRIEFISPMQGG